MTPMIMQYGRRIGGVVAVTLLLGVGSAAQADSKGQLNLTPTDRALLRGVQRNSIGLGHRQFRRYGREPYLYPYTYRTYPHSGVAPGPDMSAIRPAGRLIVTTQPADATVFVDGHPLARGVDNTFQMGLLTGAHRLEVRAPGYAAHQQDVDIRVGNHHRLDITLQPQ
ncbi:MAG: PEGA domain-containing protein [Gammaproteobacteria bacterium]|nr:PEGA domain-containing protein [Gammaproteobacteria bacterium]